MIEGWKYYNHAAIPATAPHIDVDSSPVDDNRIFQVEEKPLLARWTSDWDCGYETNWWYVIKDEPFDISTLKSKRRYEINKGNKNFVVKVIDPAEWCEDIYKVTVAAYETYPKSYRPQISHDQFTAEVKNWNFYKTYGAFSLEDNILCGYACLIKDGIYIDFCMMKAIPEKEKLGLNAAMVNMILVDHEDFLRNGGYICDGARSIQHETAFQDYLEKYFEFRKAYCRLHIVYSPKYKTIVNAAYKFRNIIKAFDKIPMARKINALLKMEEIYREPGGEVK